MPDFGIFRGFNDKLFGNKLYAGQLPTQLGLIGSESFGYLYLLDDYPNSAAAYSLRLLRSAYTGYAIKVRRASDNTEQDIGFSNNVLDTTTLASFCSGTDGFVTTWYDQSGNGNNLSQSTAANQPKIVSSGSVIAPIGGKPSIEFSGSQLIYKNWTFTISQPYTNISINRFKSLTSPTSFPYIMRNELGNDGALSLMGVINGSDLRIFNGTTLSHTLTASINTNYLWFTVPNSTSSLLSINNSNVTGNANIRALTNGVVLGGYSAGTAGLNGYISEQIIYSSNQSSNQSGIQNNINGFYSIY